MNITKLLLKREKIINSFTVLGKTEKESETLLRGLCEYNKCCSTNIHRLSQIVIQIYCKGCIDRYDLQTLSELNPCLYLAIKERNVTLNVLDKLLFEAGTK